MRNIIPHVVPNTHARLRMAVNSRALRQPSSSHVQSVVLLHDGIKVHTPPVTAQEFLGQYRSYSYTTALVRDKYHVVDWRLHLERLLRNMHILGRQTSAYSAFMAWTQQQVLGETAVVELLDALIRPQVAQALLHLAAVQGQQKQGSAMLTVLLTDPQQQQQQEQHRRPPSQSEGLPISVLVWSKGISASQEGKHAKVMVAGDSRLLPHAKHCDWVVARQPLEALKQQAGVEEVILSNSTGELLEGLVSNWYVVADEAQCEITHRATAVGASPVGPADAGNPESAASSNTLIRRRNANDTDVTRLSSDDRGPGGVSSLVLLTTGPGHDALLGVTQQRVLEAAASIGVKVLLQPSTVKQTPAWREAFVTNCLRGIQPVSTVVDTAGRTIWSRPSECDVVTKQLQEAVTKTSLVTDMTAQKQ